MLHRLLPVALIAAGFIAGCRQETPAAAPPRPVRTITVGDATALTSRTFPGRARATREVNLAFRVAGPLIERPVDVGTKVKTDDLIARIDPRDFRVDLRNKEAQLQSARSSATLAKDEFDRAEAAHERGAVSDIELSRKREAMHQADAEVAALEASVNAATDALEDTELRAPFDGEIVTTFVENFEQVIAKQRIVRLLDDSRIEMVIEIPEHLISLAPYVEEIFCVFDALPGVEIDADVKEIGSEASDVTRTFPVTLIMDQPPGARILPGMTGRAGSRRPPDQSPDEIVIPVSAIVADDDKRGFVWIVDDDNRTRQHPVTIIRLSDTGAVVEGLPLGAHIATAGAHFIVEGQEVRPMTPASLNEATP